MDEIFKANSYQIKYVIFLGEEVGEDKVVRFGKKDAGKWHRAVHETWGIKGRVGTLKNHIVHNTAENLHEYVEKMNKYFNFNFI